MRILLLGGTGFIGSHLARCFVKKGDSVDLLARPGSDTWRINDLIDNVNLIHGSLDHRLEVDDGYDALINLAWRSRGEKNYASDVSHLFLNIGHLENIIELLSRGGVKYYVGFGSAFEYGNHDLPISEAKEPEPTSYYSMSKYYTYLALNRFCGDHGICFLWLRPFFIYGPADNEKRLIPYLIESLLKKDTPKITLGGQTWDHLYVEDAVKVIHQLISMQETGIFNVASGRSEKIRIIAEMIHDRIDPNMKIEFGAYPYSKDDFLTLKADIAKLKETTGWTPLVSLPEGLDKTIQWHRRRHGSR